MDVATCKQLHIQKFHQYNDPQTSGWGTKKNRIQAQTRNNASYDDDIIQQS